jgi:hypothetical protein
MTAITDLRNRGADANNRGIKYDNYYRFHQTAVHMKVITGLRNRGTTSCLAECVKTGQMSCPTYLRLIQLRDVFLDEIDFS